MRDIPLHQIWKDAFNRLQKDYTISHLIIEDMNSCLYLLEDGREIRLTKNTRLYNFSKILKNAECQRIADIHDCFSLLLPDQYEEEERVLCVVSESINRDYFSREIKQSAILCFREIWTKCLKLFLLSVENVIDNSIDLAYIKNSASLLDLVKNEIESTSDTNLVRIMIALHEAYIQIKQIDKSSKLFLYPENIGIAQDNTIKICNIGHMFLGLNDDYEIITDNNSVTIFYDPTLNEYKSIDNRLLIQLKVDFGNGIKMPVLGMIDTGASVSGFTETFYKMASLADLGDTQIHGATGFMKSKNTECLIEFPNGYTDTLRGSTMKKTDEVSILIGMDLLSRCKFELSSYKNGFMYKLTFCESKERI